MPLFLCQKGSAAVVVAAGDGAVGVAAGVVNVVGCGDNSGGVDDVIVVAIAGACSIGISHAFAVIAAVTVDIAGAV